MFLLAKITISLISAALVYRTISRNCDRYLAFVVTALWLRFFLSAFHQITYAPLFAGFSINAIASIGIAFTGLLLLPPRFFHLKVLLPSYVFFAVVVVSGLINSTPEGLINVMLKWTFFMVIAGALFMAIRKSGKDEILKKLLVAFFMPVSLALLSVLFGEVKATEGDGSISYIGGYHHEAAFSMIIAGYILVIGLTSAKAIRYRGVLFTLGCIILMLVNYRTAVLAVLPLGGLFAYSALASKFEKRHRPVFFSVSVVGISAACLLGSYLLQDRFADIGIFLSSLDDLFKAPFYYSEAEKDIFSARVYLWSLYLYEYVNGSLVHQLFGWGPESWSGVFPKYAHNTYVSFLYEYGVVGLLTFLVTAVSFAIHSMRIKHKGYAWMLLSSMVGFLIMGFATMPLWNIEGLIFYAILIGNVIGPAKVADSENASSPEFVSTSASRQLNKLSTR